MAGLWKNYSISNTNEKSYYNEYLLAVDGQKAEMVLVEVKRKADSRCHIDQDLKYYYFKSPQIEKRLREEKHFAETLENAKAVGAKQAQSRFERTGKMEAAALGSVDGAQKGRSFGPEDAKQVRKEESFYAGLASGHQMPLRQSDRYLEGFEAGRKLAESKPKSEVLQQLIDIEMKQYLQTTPASTVTVEQFTGPSASSQLPQDLSRLSSPKETVMAPVLSDTKFVPKVRQPTNPESLPSSKQTGTLTASDFGSVDKLERREQIQKEFESSLNSAYQDLFQKEYLAQYRDAFRAALSESVALELQKLPRDEESFASGVAQAEYELGKKEGYEQALGAAQQSLKTEAHAKASEQLSKGFALYMAGARIRPVAGDGKLIAGQQKLMLDLEIENRGGAASPAGHYELQIRGVNGFRVNNLLKRLPPLAPHTSSVLSGVAELTVSNTASPPTHVSVGGEFTVPMASYPTIRMPSSLVFNIEQALPQVLKAELELDPNHVWTTGDRKTGWLKIRNVSETEVAQGGKLWAYLHPRVGELRQIANKELVANVEVPSLRPGEEYAREVELNVGEWERLTPKVPTNLEVQLVSDSGADTWKEMVTLSIEKIRRESAIEIVQSVAGKLVRAEFPVRARPGEILNFGAVVAQTREGIPARSGSFKLEYSVKEPGLALNALGSGNVVSATLNEIPAFAPKQIVRRFYVQVPSKAPEGMHYFSLRLIEQSAAGTRVLHQPIVPVEVRSW